MDQALLKTNFVGKDGFRWWIGQIAPDTAQEVQTKGAKKGGRYAKTEQPPFGNRYKVRIMGYHPYNTVELSDEDLPWATVISPPGHGTGSGGLFKTIRFQQGDTVIGFFLDGDNAQIPVIFGAFGNSIYRAEEGEELPFQAFSGYTSTLKKPAKEVLKESNSTGAVEPKSPKRISKADAEKVAEKTGDENVANIDDSMGEVVHTGCGESKSAESVSKLKVGVKGFSSDIKKVKDPKSAFGKQQIATMVDDKAESLSSVSSGLVGGMTNNLYGQMAPLMGNGLSGLYDSTYSTVLAATQSPSAANLAGIASQESMLGPVGNMEGLLPCLTNKIAGNLKDSLKSILGAIADNVDNYSDCVGDQATGAILNDVISQISAGMEDSLVGISKIQKFMGDFSVDGLLRNGADALLGMAGLGDCNPVPAPPTASCEYKLGYGPVSGGNTDLSNIIKDANAAKAISDAAKLSGFPLDGVQDILGGFSLLSGGIKSAAAGLSGGGSDGGTPCSGAMPTVCEPPKINIFGGGGEDAEAIPFYGNVVGEGKNRTGSIIGIKVTNPGDRYSFPPFVEIVDNCSQGFGAIARAVVKDGKVVEIYIVSEGEFYPVGDDIPPIVDTVFIVNPGIGYQDGDKVIDDIGNEYDAKFSNGSLVSVTPINSQDITDIPILTVVSDTGSGAILKANLDVRPEFQGEVKQVIDCVET